MVVLLVDLLDASGTLMGRVRDMVGRNPIVLVGTKMDLLPEVGTWGRWGGVGWGGVADVVREAGNTSLSQLQASTDRRQGGGGVCAGGHQGGPAAGGGCVYGGRSVGRWGMQSSGRLAAEC